MNPRFVRGLFAMAVLTLLAGCGTSEAPSVTDSETGAGGSGPEGPRETPGTSIFLNAVPPGSNGNSAGGVGAPVGPVVSYPANFNDQLSLYGNLAYARENLKAAPCEPPSDISAHETRSDKACNYYKPAGLEPDTVTESRTLTTPLRRHRDHRA